jgi:hypothetical protein
MQKGTARIAAKILVTFVSVTLLMDLLLKNTSDLQEGMWACYWASGAILVGVIGGWDRPVAWGVVFFGSIGLPAWLLGFLFGRQVYVTSILIHTIPLGAGLLYLSGLKRLPRFSAVGAWLLYAIPFGMAWYVCDPSAMINLTHLKVSLLPGFFPQLWEFYTGALVLSGVSSGIVAWLLDPLLRYRASVSGTRMKSERAGLARRRER